MALEELQQMVREYSEVDYKTLHTKSKEEIIDFYSRVNTTKCQLSVHECLLISARRTILEEIQKYQSKGIHPQHIIKNDNETLLENFRKTCDAIDLSKKLIIMLINLLTYLEENF